MFKAQPNSSIKKAAVIGSGVMGGAIAAQIANSGTPVFLFDIKAKEGSPSSIAEGAIARMLAANPSPFTHPDNAKLVTPCNLDDDLAKFAEVDWVVEAVIERLDIKQDVYRKVEANRKDGSIVSSNTSTIPLHTLIDGLPARLQADFCIAHFFNPPRFMPLLELVGGAKTQSQTLQTVRDFCDVSLGKEVVDCKDTPGFIANRIGCYWLEVGLRKAIELGLTVEEADSVMGRALGFPKTGVFGLWDLIGIDLMPLIAKALLATLPDNDRFRTIYTPVLLADNTPLIDKLIAEGYTGRKGKGGFQRIKKEGDKKIKESLDLKTGQYRAEIPSTLMSAKAKDAKSLVTTRDIGGEYAEAVLTEVLWYAASLVPEIADDITAIDRVMKNGYNWKFGPFELIDQLGNDWLIAHCGKAGLPVPELLKKAGNNSLYKMEKAPHYLGLDGKYHAVEKPAGVFTLADLALAGKPVLETEGGRLWDAGGGIACLEITTKMHTFNHEVFALIRRTITAVTKDFNGLIIGSDEGYFSAGADLNLFLFSIDSGNWTAIESLIKDGQETFQSLKYAPFPSVAAISGIALGGGCEIALHCSAVQAHIEANPGLVEVSVGLIPGWGGCKEMALRVGEQQAFNTILGAKMAGSAQEAQKMHFLNEQSGISFNRSRLLSDAKARALMLAVDYTAPSSPSITLKGVTPPHDLKGHTAHIARELAKVYTADDVNETGILRRERNVFMALVKHPESRARIEHMLKTGKPLMN